MPLPGSGQISLNQIHVEAGGSSGTQASMNDSDIRAMIGKGSGASNSFNEYYSVSAAAPSATYKGRILTTGNGFPAGWVTLSSGTKVVVVALAMPGYANTYCNLGSSGMTLAASNAQNSMSAIYYLATSASGSQYISGNGGSGRSVGHVWEITGYNSSTPVSTAAVQSANNTSSYAKTISLSTQYNGVTIGSGVCEDTIPVNGVTVSNSDQLLQIDLESATNHYSWKDENTGTGTTNYVCTQTTPGNNGSATGTFHRLAAAHWK
jgi:hypothetical protein